MTPLDLWKIARVGSPAPDTRGEFAVVPVTRYDVETNEGCDRLWLVRPNAAARPLTAADTSSSQPCVSPDGKQLAFVRKVKGAEGRQPFVMPLDGGEPRRLGDFPMGASDPHFSADGRHLVVVANVLKEAPTLDGTKKLVEQRAKHPVKAHVTENRVYRFWDRWLTDGAVPHLFLVDTETATTRDLVPDSERWFDLMDDSGQYDLSPDGAELAFSADVSRPPHRRVRMAVWTVTIAGGATRCLTPDAPADAVRPRYSPDGRYIVYGAKVVPELWIDRVRLVRFDRATGEHVVLTEDWDLSPNEWEFLDERTLAVGVDERGGGVVYRLRVDEVPAKPERVHSEATVHGLRPAAGRWLWTTQSSLERPPEVVRIDVAGASVERVTTFNDALLDELDLGKARRLSVPGADGDLVDVFVVEPAGGAGGEPRPLVHLVHGGPYGHFGDLWHFRWNPQIFAGKGWVVAMVNFHGSSSYGEKFARSILGDWGGKPAADILLATDRLVAEGLVDDKRTALTGGSYGGYMTCWLTSQTDRFACAVAHAAVFDLPLMFAGDVTEGFDLEIGGLPWGDEASRAAVQRFNPAAHTHGFKTPTLVIHGEKDYRVPVEHGLYVYGVLQARGVPARLVYYPDENHWVLRPQNSLHWYGEVLGWLSRWLDAGAEGTSEARS